MTPPPHIAAVLRNSPAGFFQKAIDIFWEGGKSCFLGITPLNYITMVFLV